MSEEVTRISSSTVTSSSGSFRFVVKIRTTVWKRHEKTYCKTCEKFVHSRHKCPKPVRKLQVRPTTEQKLATVKEFHETVPATMTKKAFVDMKGIGCSLVDHNSCYSHVLRLNCRSVTVLPNTPKEGTLDTWLDPAKKKKRKRRRVPRKRKRKKKPNLPSKELKARSKGSGERETLVVTEKMKETLLDLLLP